MLTDYLNRPLQSTILAFEPFGALFLYPINKVPKEKIPSYVCTYSRARVRDKIGHKGHLFAF